MAEVFFTFFLFIAITGVTAALFGGWMVYTVVRVIGRVIMVALGVPCPARPIRLRSSARRTCVNPRCKGINPANASFCRRCGQHLPEAQRVSVRRAAMW